MNAGDAIIESTPDGARLLLKTTGFVGGLYHVDDQYTVKFDKSAFCASQSMMKAEEGSKRLETEVKFNARPGKADSVERDLKTPGQPPKTREIDVPACVHDVVAGLARLRTINAGSDVIELPISDGKKSVTARIEPQKKEKVETPAGKFQCRRFEAHLFNGVLYRRKGHLFLWLTDDERRVPVQIKIQLPFYLGSITLQLVKEEKS